MEIHQYVDNSLSILLLLDTNELEVSGFVELDRDGL